MKINYSHLLVMALAILYFNTAQAGTLLASSYTTDNVLKFNDTTGAYEGVFISAGSGGLDQPQGFVFGNDGKFYISSFGTSQIKRYDANSGAFIDNFATLSSGSRGLAFDASNNLYAAYGSSVNRYDSSGSLSFTHTFSATATGVLEGLDGNIYVSWGTNSILGGIALFNTNTNIWNDTWRTNSSGQSWYLTQDPSGTLFLGSSGTTQVFRDNGTNLVPFLTGLPTTILDRPRGLTFNPAGNLLVGSFGSANRTNIIEFNGANGVYQNVFATGGGLDQAFYLGIRPVPIPSAFWLFGSIIAGLSLTKRRKPLFIKQS